MANITDTSLIGRQVKLLGEYWKEIRDGHLHGKIVTLEAGDGYHVVGFRPSFQPSAVYFVDENPGDAWYGELIPEAVETPANPLEGVWRSKVDPNFFVYPHTARMLMLHHRHHPGAWLMVCRVTPSRRPFQPAALNANPVFNEIEVESFLRRTLPQKNQSAEKPTEKGWEVWMRVKP